MNKFVKKIISISCLALNILNTAFSINITFIGPNDNDKINIAYKLIKNSSVPEDYTSGFLTNRIFATPHQAFVQPYEYQFRKQDPLSFYLRVSAISFFVLAAKDLDNYSSCEGYVKNELVKNTTPEEIGFLTTGNQLYRLPSPVCLCVTDFQNISSQGFQTLSELQKLTISDSSLCYQKFENEVFFISSNLKKFKFCSVDNFSTALENDISYHAMKCITEKYPDSIRYVDNNKQSVDFKKVKLVSNSSNIHSSSKSNSTYKKLGLGALVAVPIGIIAAFAKNLYTKLTKSDINKQEIINKHEITIKLDLDTAKTSSLQI